MKHGMKEHLLTASNSLLQKLYKLSHEQRQPFQAEIEELASAVHKTTGF